MLNQPSIEIINLGRTIPYANAVTAQRTRRVEVETGKAPEALFLLEHSPVITLGRNADGTNLRASREALAKLGIDVVETDRGGDVTYHGPGQLVAYPVLHLTRRGLSITRYLRMLEQAVIDTLAELGLRGERINGYTGVWVNGAKVAAIGIAVHHGVSFHGTAINIDPDMNHWGLIVPCGIPDKPVTSLRRLLNDVPTTNAVADIFSRVFLASMRAATPNPERAQQSR